MPETTNDPAAERRYRWADPHAWLHDQIAAAGTDPKRLTALAAALAENLDGDAVQDAFLAEMQQTGYFDPLPVVPTPLGTLTKAEHNAVLAGLRVLQLYLGRLDDDIDAILTDGGVDPLRKDGIDVLIERLNTAPAPKPPVEYVYFYRGEDDSPLRECPGCRVDLTRPGGVDILFTAGGQTTSITSRLAAEDGRLVDTADGAVRRGFHAGTECSFCGCDLAPYTRPCEAAQNAAGGPSGPARP